MVGTSSRLTAGTGGRENPDTSRENGSVRWWRAPTMASGAKATNA